MLSLKDVVSSSLKALNFGLLKLPSGFSIGSLINNEVILVLLSSSKKIVNLVLNENFFFHSSIKFVAYPICVLLLLDKPSSAFDTVL